MMWRCDTVDMERRSPRSSSHDEAGRRGVDEVLRVALMKRWRSPRSSRGDGAGRRGDAGAPTSADVSKQVGVVVIGLKKRRCGDADAGRNFVTRSMPA